MSGLISSMTEYIKLYQLRASLVLDCNAMVLFAKEKLYSQIQNSLAEFSLAEMDLINRQGVKKEAV